MPQATASCSVGGGCVVQDAPTGPIRARQPLLWPKASLGCRKTCRPSRRSPSCGQGIVALLPYPDALP